MNLTTVKSVREVKKIREIYDSIEIHVRNLNSLKIETSQYGPVLVSIVMPKLREDIRLLITRTMPTNEEWDVNILLENLKQEIDSCVFVCFRMSSYLDDAYLDSEVNFINGKINDLSRHHISEKHHLAWKTIKELSSKNPNSAIRIKGGSSKKRLENWSNHFKNLLGKEARLPENCTLPSVTISEPLNIDTSPLTISELKAATKQLKPSKAFGPDNIPALIWKDGQLKTSCSTLVIKPSPQTNVQLYGTDLRSFQCLKKEISHLPPTIEGYPLCQLLQSCTINPEPSNPLR